MCAWMGVLFANKYVLGNNLRASNDALEKEILRYHQLSQQTERENEMLNTAAGKELVARKYGWIMPDERKLRISDDRE